ncbi:MAG: 16S rRNA (guanine(966)-N(2))-methyltransferase RsmD [Neisseria sp.]|nr:16S rRNA (guanine(966)-N(2))-methyltransferase RsmD [Neisseria sp.]
MRHAKHKNQVRIIGGTHRSRLLRFRDADGLRPSADAVREKLFNWLGQTLHGKSVLDLFAGSAVLGCEAASRGAARTVLVEANPRTCAEIAANLELLRLPEITLHRGDALQYLKQTQEMFDVVLLDPPYAWQDWEALWTALLPRLNPHAEVYAEAAAEVVLPAALQERKRGRSGMSYFVLARYAAADESERKD